MKNNIILVCVLIQLIMLGDTIADQHENFTYSSDGLYVTINGYTGSNSLITIPDSINGLPVSKIGYRAFYGNFDITSAIIPHTLTEIDDYAFSWCINLTSQVPYGVESIGYAAFNNCQKLGTVVIPDSVTTLGENAFQSCTGLTNVLVGDGLTYIQDRTFSWCRNLLAVTIGNNVVEIGDSAFEQCTNLTNIHFGSSVRSIYDSSFKNCNQLRDLIFPDNLSDIGASSFLYCSNISSIRIPSSILYIGDSAFQYCDKLSEVFICNTNIFTLREDSFADCTNLTGVYFEGILRFPPKNEP